MAEARALGVEVLHLFTTEARGYYERDGWRVLQPMEVQGRSGVIMHFGLGTLPTSFLREAAAAAPTREEL
jgi:hypothetical protein